MPKLIKRIIKGRKQFDFNQYDNAKGVLWDHIAAAPRKVPGNTDTEDFARRIDALAMHCAGMPIKDAALTACITPAELYSFKSRWLSRDSSLSSVLANLLESAAIKSVVVFNKKADQMDASEAASAASTLTKAAVTLRTGVSTNYTPPENVALETLDRIGKVLDAAGKVKMVKGKTIDLPED